MRMMKVQFGPDEGCFVVVLMVQAEGVESNEQVVARARQAAKDEWGMGDADLDDCGKPIVEDVTNEGARYSVTEP